MVTTVCGEGGSSFWACTQVLGLSVQPHMMSEPFCLTNVVLWWWVFLQYLRTVGCLHPASLPPAVRNNHDLDVFDILCSCEMLIKQIVAHNVGIALGNQVPQSVL